MTTEAAATPPSDTPHDAERGTPLRNETRRGEDHPAWTALFVTAALVPIAHAARIGELPWTAGALLLALVPFAVILSLVGVLQFRNPRPRASRRWALLWGLLVATGASSYANGLLGGEPTWSRVVILAPFVEELAKGAGLLILLRLGRIRTPVDGIMYALLIGGGFSLLENTFYFFNAIAAELGGDDGVLQDVFVMRGLVSPFAHPIFLATLGVALGTRARRNPLLLLSAFSLGVMLHALWNHAAISGVVTNLVPHTVALTLALAAGALLRANREGPAGTASPGQDHATGGRAPAETHDGASWYAALPWYDPKETRERRTEAAPANRQPPA